MESSIILALFLSSFMDGLLRDKELTLHRIWVSPLKHWRKNRREQSVLIFLIERLSQSVYKRLVRV